MRPAADCKFCNPGVVECKFSKSGQEARMLETPDPASLPIRRRSGGGFPLPVAFSFRLAAFAVRGAQFPL